MMLLGQRTDPGDTSGGGGAGDTSGGGDRLGQGLGHRAEVHQATGMVLAQLDVTAIDALARLRAHAFLTGRLLLDVAQEVVERRLVFTSDMP